jgi:predicted NACHT family NTPase
VLLAEGHRPATEETFALADWGGTLTEKRSWLAFLAYQMMNAGEEVGKEIEENRVREWLRPRLVSRSGEDKADEQLENFIEAMRERGSILDERDGIYRFTHLTFQEFLAAYYLVQCGANTPTD